MPKKREILECDFTPIFSIDPTTNKMTDVILRPYLRMLLGKNDRIVKNPINCLLDSGSDNNLFPASWGKEAGIQIKNGEKVRLNGIGGVRITAYTHKIKLYFADIDITFETEADFSFEQEIPLLGRKGFFDKFQKVTFDQTREKIRLEL